MAVSGCKIQCAENCIKDLSMFGTDKGWTIKVGGIGSMRPRLADVLIEDLSTQEAEDTFNKVINCYKENAKRERIGKMVDKMGFDAFKQAVLG